MRSKLLLIGLVALSGCMRKIPGTEIDDTADSRAILDVMTAYRAAVEQRNPQAIIDLADPQFRDDGGSATPDDDLDYSTLYTSLATRFQRIEDVRLDMNVRRMEFDDGSAAARVTYTYTLSFKMPTLSGRTQTDTDIKQMVLRRTDESGGKARWRIVSGI
ncbi:MAG: DUF4440 domain-containing protein [Myxococcaceae bacterium]|nr:DUF4440 domain-containing protein [Myxococcaceae bacterium]